MAKTFPDTPSEKILVEWTAPSRPYKKRNREYYTTIASITFLLAVILLLMKEFLLIGVIIALAFLAYVLASIPPENITHQLTTKGIRTDNKLFPWDQLLYFWTTKKWKFEIINIKTKQPIPGYLLLIIDPPQKETILKIITQHLTHEKPDNSFVDRASTWLQKKFPLETS